jgi:hypothetical protein
MHTDTQTHSAAATHTTTLHTQRARHHGSNTQRRRGIAHPPTTASSSVQRSHSRAHTQHLQHGVTVAAGSYTTAVRHCDCDVHDHRTRVALVRSMDCQRSTRATPHAQYNAAVTHACTQRTETPTHEQSTTDTIPRSAAPSHSSHSETRCSDAHATTQIRNRYSLRSRQRRRCTHRPSRV